MPTFPLVMGTTVRNWARNCQRDGTFCEGYDKRLTLRRTQTIMQGASHCDFDYTYDKEAKA